VLYTKAKVAKVGACLRDTMVYVYVLHNLGICALSDAISWANMFNTQGCMYNTFMNTFEGVSEQLLRCT